MKKDILAIYYIWVIVLLVEIGWLSALTNRPHSTIDIIIRVMVIVTTLVVGAIGIVLFRHTYEK